MIETLSIVVPAFNEAGNIEATVADALRVASATAPTVEIVVCNDGSTDDTGAMLDRLAAREPRLRVVHRARNRGIEASIRALYRLARHDWIFLNSADRQWPMEVLAPMAEAARAGADLVLGVRHNKRDVYTPYRRALSWGYERIVRVLGGPGADPGSIKLGRRELLDVPVVALGVFAEGERIIRAARRGARVVEVPVEFHRRRAGKATGARRDVVARAAVDAARVASSLLVGWPRPARSTADDPSP